MKRATCVWMLLISTWLSGCGGASPYENGKAYGKSIVSSLKSGNPSAMQKAMADAQAQTRNMSPSDAAEFLRGYNEVALP